MEYTAGSRPFSLRNSRKEAGSGREDSCCSSVRSETELAEGSRSSIFLGSVPLTRNCQRPAIWWLVAGRRRLLCCPRCRREGPAPQRAAAARVERGWASRLGQFVWPGSNHPSPNQTSPIGPGNRVITVNSCAFPSTAKNKPKPFGAMGHVGAVARDPSARPIYEAANGRRQPRSEFRTPTAII
jgi:hypothetical protein